MDNVTSSCRKCNLRRHSVAIQSKAIVYTVTWLRGERNSRGTTMSFSNAVQILAQAATQTATDVAAKTADGANSVAAATGLISGETFAMLLVAGVAFITVMALLFVNHRVGEAKDWSLADALSEEVEVGTDKKDAAGNPVKDNNGNIAKDSIMKASSSRLIALLGTIAIMMLYIGGGLSVLYKFAIDGEVPHGTKDLSTFFLYGMVLFAPYIVNKFSSIFSWMK